MSTPIRLFIADDHQMFVEGIKALLCDIEHIRITGEANNGADVLRKLEKDQPDVILMDIGMPGQDGIETTSIISEKYPAVKIIALTMYDDNNRISKMLKAGVKGYVLKNTSREELLRAIETVFAGNVFYSEQVTQNVMKKISGENADPVSSLTKREIEIIRLIARSMTNKEIANQLFLSELTVKTHRQNAMHKLGVVNTAGLVRFAMDNHIIDQ